MSLFDRFTKKENKTFAPSSVLPAIIETLNQAGYKAQRDTDVCVVYDDDGLHCYFWYSERDPEFLMVRATFERAAFEDVHESYLYKACSMTDFDQKVSKAYIDEDGDVVFSVEAFIMEGTPLGRLALRMSDALASTVAFFHRTLKQLTEEQGSGVGGSDAGASQLPPSGSLPS